MNTNTTYAAATTQSVRAGINQRKFFESMKHLFATSYSVLGELMQNARRAGASTIKFHIDPTAKTMSVTDDGCGVSDFGVLINMCESAWNEQTMLTDKPFGMGLFGIFFAGSMIVFRSNGLRLETCLADIAEKRELQAIRDPSPVETGTVIEVLGLSEALLKSEGYFRAAGSELQKYVIANEISKRACGFPIPVFVNGDEMARPHAQAALIGESTKIGFVKMAGVHEPESDSPTRIASSTRNANVATYLQGLPIGRACYPGAEIVVHLDSSLFIARMPDRSELFDPSEQWTKILAEINAVGVRHLVQEKARLRGDTFVARYWSACFGYGCAHLLNDIPWVPKSELSCVDLVQANSDESWSNDQSSKELVSRADIVNGKVKIWRHPDTSTGDSAWAPVALKVMQREDVLFFGISKLPKGHWIEAITQRSSDLQFAIEPINLRGQASYTNGTWEKCTLHLVDQVNVVVTSTVDPSYRLTCEVVADWLVVPVATDGEEIDPDLSSGETVCYVMETDKSPDHPIDVFDTWFDENDHYDDAWRNECLQCWNSLVGGLTGQTLAKALEAAVRNTAVEVCEAQASHMALVRTVQCRDWKGDLGRPTMQVLDLEDLEFWLKVATAFTDSALSGTSQTADQLKAAFIAVVKPGEQEKPTPDQAASESAA